MPDIFYVNERELFQNSQISLDYLFIVVLNKQKYFLFLKNVFYYYIFKKL